MTSSAAEEGWDRGTGVPKLQGRDDTKITFAEFMGRFEDAMSLVPLGRNIFTIGHPSSTRPKIRSAVTASGEPRVGQRLGHHGRRCVLNI